jgi:hypothetical protein
MSHPVQHIAGAIIDRDVMMLSGSSSSRTRPSAW